MGERVDRQAGVSPLRARDGDRVAPGDDAWRPIVLDETRAADRDLLNQLRGDSNIELVDRLERQRAEMARIRRPDGDPLPDLENDGVRWVYYPWRRAVVRLLGPASFDAVRLDRNRNKITPQAQRTLRARKVGVVGLSVGHAVAHLLAVEGLCGELRLADLDDLELSNLNRVAASVFDVGVNKAVLAARRIAEVDPYLNVSIVPTGLTSDNIGVFLDGLDLVVEECDSLDIKLRVREEARLRGIPVVMETSDRGLLDVERFDQEPDRPPFHGLIGTTSAQELAGLSAADKVPEILRIVEPQHLSATLAASMVEVGRSITTWPQLATDVAVGSAAVASVARLLGGGQPVRSGRVRLDIEAALEQLQTPEPVAALPPPGPGDPLEPAPEEPVAAIAYAASLAPSGGNVQPWRFVARGDRLSFYLRPECTTTLDVAFRGSYVALGAALYNARVAAAALRRAGRVEYFPDPTDQLRVADLVLGDRADDELGERYGAMLARQVNRKPGRPAPLPPAVAAQLQAVARAEGGQLFVSDERAVIDQMADVLGASDRLRYLTPALHDEMIAELRWPGSDDLATGLDVRTLEMVPTDLAKLAIVSRSDIMAELASWNAGQALGDLTRDLMASSSALVVVSTTGREPRSYLQGGSALEAVWLTAETLGLAVQPMSPIFLFATDHDELRSLVPEAWLDELVALAAGFRQLVAMPEGSWPVLVLRLSDAPPATIRSRRLPLKTVLSRDNESSAGDEE